MSLDFTKDAYSDLLDISRFTRRTYGKRQAVRYIEQIEHCCKGLAAGRYRGRPADSISSGLRKQIVESHVVFFRLSNRDVVIVRILHVAMNHEDHL
jgi:toxin ParE1/3/4